jgi:hypothetical protein
MKGERMGKWREKGRRGVSRKDLHLAEANQGIIRARLGIV